MICTGLSLKQKKTFLEGEGSTLFVHRPHNYEDTD